MRASKNVCVWERDRKGRTSTFSPSLKASWSPTIWILWRLLHRSWQSILNWIPNLGQHIVRQRDYAAQIPGCQSAKADNVLQTRKNPSSSLWSLGWRGRNKQTVCEGGVVEWDTSRRKVPSLFSIAMTYSCAWVPVWLKASRRMVAAVCRGSFPCLKANSQLWIRFWLARF